MRKLGVTGRYQKWLLRLVMAVGSFLLALWLQVPAIAVDYGIFISALDDKVAAQASPMGAAQLSIEQFIEQGIADYDRGQLASAIAHWKAALAQIESPLTTAYLLSNIATTQQQLGQPQLAQAAIEQASTIIQNWSNKDLAYWEISARVLNTQGQTLWQQGQIQAAFTTWQQAEQHYKQSGLEGTSASQNNLSGFVLTQINQALALQELGFNARAVQKLTQLNPQIKTLPPALQLAATAEFGRALRQVGELSAAQSVLLETLSAISNGANNGTSNGAPQGSALQAQTLQLQLELANTARASSHRAMTVGDDAMAKSQSEQALDYYARVVQNSLDLSTKVQAQLNQLSYLIEIGELDKADAIAQTIDLDAVPLGQASLEATIGYARSLSCLQSPTYCVRQEWRASAQGSSVRLAAQRSNQISSLFVTAIDQAQTLQNPVLESYAVGGLAHLYELTDQVADAIALTERAIALVEGRQRPEAAYLWEWQLGRLYRDSNRQQQAIAAYQQAIQSLTDVRQNLIAIDAQTQFSFLDNVEPVYRELVSLLLSQSSDDASAQALEPTQAALGAAIQTVDALQLTELENFLGCNLSALVNIGETSIDPNAIKIYPIILFDRLAIITEVPGQPLQLQTVSVSQPTLDAALISLRANLTLPGKTPQVLAAASQLYDWLIAPIAPILADNPQIQTLVFVPDGLLRNIPLGVLYDGEQYLIEKGYALAIAPQLNLFAPAQNDQPLKILTGGVSLAQTIRGQAFSTIEFLDAELEQIPKQFTVAPPLLNEAFTQNNLEQQLSSERYTAIHWKTHGVFSSIPAETFLVAYQDGITANDLSALVKSASERQAEPLELVVLSACETAQGDRRAILGLAGIAVRAGTRSTLSTLWRADDGANTQLMSDFYQGLQTGLSKAQALQNAQQALLTDGGYPAPYYWAPYVLVGNWL